MTFTRLLYDWKILRFHHRLAGFFCLFLRRTHLYSVFVQNDKICSVTKYLYYFIFLRKRNLIIVFPVTNGTFDPVSVLVLM